MPFTFWSQLPCRAAAPRARAGVSPSVADEIVHAGTIDRLTLWPTLRIRACLQLSAASFRARSR